VAQGHLLGGPGAGWLGGVVARGTSGCGEGVGEEPASQPGHMGGGSRAGGRVAVHHYHPSKPWGIHGGVCADCDRVVAGKGWGGVSGGCEHVSLLVEVCGSVACLFVCLLACGGGLP